MQLQRNSALEKNAKGLIWNGIVWHRVY